MALRRLPWSPSCSHCSQVCIPSQCVVTELLMKLPTSSSPSSEMGGFSRTN